jgi:hypothetical protein
MEGLIDAGEFQCGQDGKKNKDQKGGPEYTHKFCLGLYEPPDKEPNRNNQEYA